jgi:RNA 3'-terminal phosphate cyclase (ATP)
MSGSSRHWTTCSSYCGRCWYAWGPPQAIGQGGALVLRICATGDLIGDAEAAQRGIPVERIAANAAGVLREDIATGSALDSHAADQVLVHCTFATGPSCFLARHLSSHALTTLWLLQRFLPLAVAVRTVGASARVDIQPSGTSGNSAAG